MQTIRHRSIAALGAIAATFATVAAASPARAASVSVHYNDLDLRSPAGAKTLERRIRTAATRVCGAEQAYLRAQMRDCRQQAIADATASVPAIQPATRIAAR